MPNTYLLSHTLAGLIIACFLFYQIGAKIRSKEDTYANAYTLVAGDNFGDSALIDREHPINYFTYISEGPTELLIILKHDFDRLQLARHCFEKLKSRYIRLRKMKLFVGWSKAEVTRIARMSHTKTIPAKTMILEQHEKPNHLHILLRGTCKVAKVPSPQAELIQKKLSIQNQIMRIKTKYSYHHSIKPKSGTGLTATEARYQELTEELATITAELESLNREQAINDLSLKQEFHTLTSPAMFGEECIIDPQYGVAQGSFTVSCHTYSVIQLLRLVMPYSLFLVSRIPAWNSCSSTR